MKSVMEKRRNVEWGGSGGRGVVAKVLDKPCQSKKTKVT